MNQFTERYKIASNTELLKIIENSDDYQPLAVETAKTELDSRQLNEQDLSTAKEELNIIRQKSELKEQKKQELISKVKNVANSTLDNINPIQESPLKTDKLIKLISIVFGAIAVYQIIKEFGMLSFMFSDQGEWDFSLILYFLPLILIPTATILFWLRKKIGWILLCIYLSYSVVNTIGLIIMTWDMQSSGNSALDSLFPVTSPTIYIMTSFFFIGSLWVINKLDLRDVFNIDLKTMIGTIGLTTFISVLMIIQYL
jgi:hypothetical protein